MMTGCRKKLGKFPYGDMILHCGDGFDAEVALCEKCKKMKKEKPKGR